MTDLKFIPCTGNLGDAVITAGVLPFLETWPEQRSRFLFRGGLFEPHLDNINRLASLDRGIPLTMLPCSFGKRTAAILTQFRDLQVFCRDANTFQIAQNHGLRATLVHDLAFGVDYSPWEGRIGEGTLNCFRGDIESMTNYRPSDNRDLSADRQEDWHLRNYEEPAKRFISEIANFAKIRTDRLHVAIVGAMLNREVELFEGLGSKNKAVFDYSLRPRGNVAFHTPRELIEGINVRGMIIHQGSRMDRKDSVRRLFKDVGNCGVFEAVVPQWDTAANRAVRGCSLSHLAAIMQHLSEPVDWLLVLEDDAVMLPAFREEFLKLSPNEIPSDCVALVIGGDCANVTLSNGKFMKILPPFWGSHAVVYNLALIRRTQWLAEAMFIVASRQLGPDGGANGICYESVMMLAGEAVGALCYRMKSMSFTTTGGFSARSQTVEPPRSEALTAN